ncbi:MAG: hypothetical protein ACI3XP_01470 [Eubacteriales bacterium]
MGILERALNTAMHWENRDITTKEMAELMERMILQNADAYYLQQLKDAMQKKRIWMIGHGGSARRYSFCDGNVEVVTEYSLLTRTMNMVQLWDNPAKISYFIHTGCESARELCARVLACIARYQHT